jgi:hypothetical protein
VTNDFFGFFLLFQQRNWDVFGKMCFFGVNSFNLTKFLKINLYDLYHNFFIKKNLGCDQGGWAYQF